MIPESCTNRRPPEILHIPTPRSEPFRLSALARALAPLLAFLTLIIVVSILARQNQATLAAAVFWMISDWRRTAVAFVVVLVSIMLPLRLISIWDRKQRQRWIAEWTSGFAFAFGPKVAADLMKIFLGRWKGGLLFNPPQFVRVLGALPWKSADRAHIAVLGTIELPPWSEHRLEPLIVDPDRDARRAAFAVAAITLAGFVFVLIERRPTPDVTFAFLSLGALLFAFVLWTAGGVGTRYWRITPGLIEQLRFRPFARRPRTTSYPVSAGTRILLHLHPSKGNFRKQDLTVVVVRAGSHGAFTLSALSGPESDGDRFLRAIFSSAPAPALPQNELLG